MERKNELLIRAYLVTMFFVLMTVVIFYRVVKVSLVEGDKWRAQGGKNVKMVPLQADRGNIYSDDGTVLVTSLPFFDIRMDLNVVRDDVFNSGIDSLAWLLSRDVGKQKTAEQWRSDLRDARTGKLPGHRYYRIAEDISYDQLVRLKKFPIFRKGRYGGGGLIVEKRTVREKPFRTLAQRTLGEMRDNASNYGLESFFDEYLRGTTDSLLMKKVPGGTWIPVYDVSDYLGKEGDDIYTTLDVDIQDILQQELLKSVELNQAKGGTAVVMDVKTGAIKAISNMEWSEKRQKYLESYNHAIGTASEPGSTFKTATVLALLDDQHAKLNSKVDLRGGKKKFYSEWMYDSHMHGKREASLLEAFAISSNVGIAHFAMEAYERQDSGRINFRNKFRQFRLDQKTGIELEGERSPRIKNPLKKEDRWSGTTVPWMAHGYELHLTPLQILAFYNAIANDGKYVKPYLVKEIRRDGELLKKFNPRGAKKKLASPYAIKGVQRMLKEVVLSGTAKAMQSDVVDFSGKTGTAIAHYKDQEEEKVYNGSFAGYFPSNNPRYSVMVLIYEPKQNYHGAKCAGPVFKAVAEKVFALKYDQFQKNGIEKSDNSLPQKQPGYAADFKKVLDHTGIKYERKAKQWAVLEPSEEKVKMDRMKIKKNIVPDVVGMGLRDAMYVLENLGMQVNIDGVGKVRSQSVSPGTKINGQAISLFLK